MIGYVRAWWARINAPTYARLHAQQWAEARRERQMTAFVVDKLALFPHGIDPL